MKIGIVAWKELNLVLFNISSKSKKLSSLNHNYNSFWTIYFNMIFRFNLLSTSTVYIQISRHCPWLKKIRAELEPIKLLNIYPLEFMNAILFATPAPAADAIIESNVHLWIYVDQRLLKLNRVLVSSGCYQWTT